MGRGDRVTENEIGTIVVDAAIAVHRELGPGLLESVSVAALAHELRERGLGVACQVAIPVAYKGMRFEEGFRADMVVADKVIVEVKSVEKVTPAHKKQLQTYLRLSGLRLGYLLNFGEALMSQGITRCVNGLPESPKVTAFQRGCAHMREAPRAETRRCGGVRGVDEMIGTCRDTRVCHLRIPIFSPRSRRLCGETALEGVEQRAFLGEHS